MAKDTEREGSGLCSNVLFGSIRELNLTTCNLFEKILNVCFGSKADNERTTIQALANQALIARNMYC